MKNSYLLPRFVYGWHTCEMLALKAFFCAEHMEVVVVQVYGQKSITGRSNNVYTAWCLYYKYDGSLDNDQ